MNDDDEVTRDYYTTPTPPPAGAPGRPAWTPPPTNTPPPPSADYPPHYSPPQYSAPQYSSPQVAPDYAAIQAKGSRTGWIIGGAVVLVVVIAVAAYLARDYFAPPTPSDSGGDSTSASNSSQSAVPQEALSGFLADGPALATLLGVDSMQKITEDSEDSRLWGNTTDHSECGGVALPGMHETLDGSGYLRAVVQGFQDRATGDWQRRVDQAVYAFTDDKAAQAFVKTMASRWAKCKNTEITMKYDDGGSRSSLGLAVGDTKMDGGDLIATLQIPSYGAGFACQHQLTSRRNVAIDVRTCDFGGSALAGTIVDDIAKRITTTK